MNMLTPRRTGLMVHAAQLALEEIKARIEKDGGTLEDADELAIIFAAIAQAAYVQGATEQGCGTFGLLELAKEVRIAIDRDPCGNCPACLASRKAFPFLFAPPEEVQKGAPSVNVDPKAN